jgi:hypothetical protein
MKMKNSNDRAASRGKWLSLVAMAIAGTATSEAALVSSIGPVLFSNTTTTSSANLDVDSDLNEEFVVVFIGQGSLSIQGVGAANLAGTFNGDSFEPTAFEASGGFTIGSGLTYSGNESDDPNFGSFAEESTAPNEPGAPIIGEWTGGRDAYFGFSFTQDDGIHYGYGRLIYDPNETANTSSARFPELTYETVAEDDAVFVPEPSSFLLLGLGFSGFFLRRKRVA